MFLEKSALIPSENEENLFILREKSYSINVCGIRAVTFLNVTLSQSIALLEQHHATAAPSQVAALQDTIPSDNSISVSPIGRRNPLENGDPVMMWGVSPGKRLLGSYISVNAYILVHVIFIHGGRKPLRYLHILPEQKCWAKKCLCVETLYTWTIMRLAPPTDNVC